MQVSLARIFTTVLVLLVASGAAAQESDRRWIETWLESRFSGGGQVVRITGFAGGLRSAARIERLEIADSSGVWLEGENIELSLRRSALLLGRLEMPRMTADRLSVFRKPIGTDTGLLPQPEAGLFRLPDPSWTISVGELQIGRLDLDEAVFGRSMVLAVDGVGTFARRAIDVELSARPIGDTEFSAMIYLEYDRRSERLVTNVDVTDGPGGPVAQMLGGDVVTPFRLAIEGEGQIDAFDARLSLMAAQTETVSGSFSLSALERESVAEPARTIRVVGALGGDFRSFAPEALRPVLGPFANVTLAGQFRPGGPIDLSSFNLSSERLRGSGGLRLSPDGVPEFANLSLSLEPSRGAAEQRGGAASIDLQSSTATIRLLPGSGNWRAVLSTAGFTTEAIEVGATTLAWEGSVRRDDAALIFDGETEFEASQVSPSTDSWRLSDLSGRLGGRIEPLTGGFDVTVDADALASWPMTSGGADLSGPHEMAATLRRDSAGFEIPSMILRGPFGSMNANADLSSDGSAAEARVTLSDKSPFASLAQGRHQLRLTVGTISDIVPIVAAYQGRLGNIDAEIELAGSRSRPRVSGIVDARIPSIRSLSSAIGLPTARGSVDARLEGGFDYGTGWEVTSSGQAGGFALGTGFLDALHRGSLRFDLDAQGRRGVSALTSLRLQSDILQLDGSGRAETGRARFEARANISDLGRVAPGLRGSAQANLGLARLGPTADWALTASATGPGGLNVSSTGRIRADGSPNTVSLSGDFPLTLLDLGIAPASVTGGARLALTLDREWSLSAMSGRASVSDATYVNPNARITLTRIRGVADIASGSAMVDATGRSTRGGEVSVAGRAALARSGTSDLTAGLRGLVFGDGANFDTVLNGTLRFELAGLSTGNLSGDVFLSDTRVRLGTPASARSEIPEIEHIDEPDDVRETRRRAGLLDVGIARSQGRAIDATLNVRLQTSERISVTGLGFEGDFSGGLLVTGTVAEPRGEGAFQLGRGQLSFGRRVIDVDDGRLTFAGNLVPEIFFAASSRFDGVDAQLSVEGTIDAPSVRFASQPELPEDEIAARLLLGRPLERLSALDALRLADQASVLLGNGRTGLLERVRRRLPVNALRLDRERLQLVQYLSDNAYSTLEVDRDGGTVLELNIDLSPSLSITSKVANDRDNSVGIFFHRDY